MEDVIVVGAGPTGLWAAAELALAGLSVLVVEQNEYRSPHSKALGIHARTLEIFEMRGIVDMFLSEGRPVPMWHYGMLSSRVDLRLLDTKYPYMLAIPQKRTEELLEIHALSLGVTISRGEKLLELRQDDQRATLQLTSKSGTRSVSARYVIGADGSRSTVRQQAGVEFRGWDGTKFGFIGEVLLSNPPSAPSLSCFNEDGAMIVVPLGGGRFRLAGYDAHKQEPGDELTFERLRELCIQFFGDDFGMRDPSWLTRFSDQTRLADNYRMDRVFLAGDAAHISWPTGGVGLNVGVQDAMNLSWKIAQAIRNPSADWLLDTYSQERWPVGKDLIDHTLAQGALITATTASGRELRAWLSSVFATHQSVAFDIAMKLSGLDVGYKSDDRHHLVGQRVPDLELTNGQRLHSAMRAGRSVRLVNSASAAAASTPSEFGQLDTFELGGNIGLKDWSLLSDAIVRPDGHLGWIASTGDQIKSKQPMLEVMQ